MSDGTRYGRMALAILRHRDEFGRGVKLPGEPGEPCELPGLTPDETAELGRLRDEARRTAPTRRS